MQQLLTRKARSLLIDHGCIKVRNGSHEIWQRSDGRKFSLPVGKKTISFGVVKKLRKFLTNQESYLRG